MFCWNYTVHNATPYHMIVSFERIGLFDNPVTLTPHSSTTVNSFISWIDYCYAGAHLLIQPLPNQPVPQVMYQGHQLALTSGKMPNQTALNQLVANIREGVRIGAGITGTAGGIVGGLATGIGTATFAGPAGFYTGIAVGAPTGAATGTAIGGALGATIGLLGSLTAVSENEVAYTAPYLPIAPAFDACWNRTIALDYNDATNQLIATVE
jgi:uncharacterized membrane protein